MTLRAVLRFIFVVAVCSALLDSSFGQLNCGATSECAVGSICSAGSCQAAPTAAQVVQCVILPPSVVRQDATVRLFALAKNASGRAISFSQFRWSLYGPGTIDDRGTVTANGAGELTVIASAGQTSSCATKVISYPRPAANDFRVVVVEALTSRPIVGAAVVVDQSVGRTDASGISVHRGLGAGPHDVHVFAAGYHYTSFIGAASKDLLVPLAPNIPANSRSGFIGKFSSRDFQQLPVQGEAVHLAFFGSGVPGSPIDLTPQKLAGQLRPVTINATTRSLPSGLVLGLSDNMFGTEEYRIYADAGARVIWGIGGNLSLTDVIGALGPVLNGNTSNIDVGALLAQLLPLFGKLSAGQVVGVDPPSNGDTPNFSPVTIPLDARPDLRAAIMLPDRPAKGDVFVIGAALHDSLGIVPLGFSDDVSKPLNLAPLSYGLEESRWTIIAQVMQPGGLSALVKTVDEIRAAAAPIGGEPVVFDRPFMKPTRSGHLDASRRMLFLPAHGDSSTVFYRIDIHGAGGDWQIWSGSSSHPSIVALPDPRTFDLPDPLRGSSSATIIAGSLVKPATYDLLSAFDGVHVDRLGALIDAFTLAQFNIN